MKKLCSLFLVFVLLFSTAATTFAISDSDSNVTENNMLHELENAILFSEGSYSYTAPDGGSFLIESVTGAVSITNEVAAIEFGNHIVPIPSFDYYKIVDHNGDLRFYQADVSKTPNQTSNFAYIGLYIEDGPTYSIHIHYAVSAENKLYNIMVPLTQEQFLFFTEGSTEMCLGTDAVSQRLKASARVHTHGTFENHATSSLSNGDGGQYNTTVMPAALNTVAANSYDSYTNSDGIIHSYVSDYWGEYYLEDDWTITDDPIVNIIPKDLCFVLGEHIYVGKEYGFFIRVVVDSINTNCYLTDILIFDITHITPSFTSPETGSSKVTPLFQYTYCAADADTIYSDVDPTLSRVVIPHVQYDYAEYHLRDVGFKFTLDNPTALNPDDSGYVASNDNGAFMIQTRVNARGVGLKKKGESFAADTAAFALGFVPYIGAGLSVFAYVHDVYNGFGNGNYRYTRSEEFSDNELNINTYKTNSTDQITAYGNLLKSQSIELTSDETKPRLIHVGGGYVEAKYVIARKSGSTYNKIRVITSISVEVVEDNTELFLDIFPRGELIEYGRCTGTYETGAYKRLNNVSLSGWTYITVPANSQTNVIRIVPQTSGSYKFTTSSSSGDPHFRITNATTGAVVSATDDIDGANNRNATLTITLTAGNIYYLEAFRYGTPYGYNLVMQPMG